MMEVLGGEFSNLQEGDKFNYMPEENVFRQMSVSRSKIRIIPIDELDSKEPAKPGMWAPSPPLVLSDDGFKWDQNFITTTLYSVTAELNLPTWELIRGKAYKDTIVVGVMLATLKYERHQEPKSKMPNVNGSFVDRVVSFAPNQIHNASGQWFNHVQQSKDKKQKEVGQVHAEMFLAALLGAFIERLKGGTERYIRKGDPKWITENCPALSAGPLTFDGHIYINSETVGQVMCTACTNVWKKLVDQYPPTEPVEGKEQKFKSTYALF